MKKILSAVIVLAGMFRLADAQVVTFPATDSMQRSEHFTIKANGKDVMVYDVPFASYAVFDFTGKVEVDIQATTDIKWVDVRPLSLGIQPEFKDSFIHLTLTKPCNLSIELNGDYLKFPLYLFTNAPEVNAPKPGDKGVIYFEGGKVHNAGLITPKSGETVYIAGGAVVKGAINASDVENVKVMGRGILLGTDNRAMGVRSRSVDFRNSKNILFKDFLVVDSHSWEVVPTNCNNVEINGLRIISDNGGDDGIDVVSCKNVRITNCFIHTKDDCISIKSMARGEPVAANCEDILVENNTFWNAAWGNALEIGFELRSAFVRNIVFRDNDIIHVQMGAAFSIHNSDSATVENVLFENIRVEQVNQKLIDLGIFRSLWSLDKPPTREEQQKQWLLGAWDNAMIVPKGTEAEHAKYRGQIRNVVFKDIAVDGYKPFSIINGYDKDHMIENITIQNLTFCGHRVMTTKDLKLYQEFAKGIVIK